MNGVILIAFNDFVEARYGIDAWEDILRKARVASKGVYTSIQSYDDIEIAKLAHSSCAYLNLTSEQLLKDFGFYIFPKLSQKFPIFTSIQPDIIRFLSGIESVVHVEVKKLFPDAYLPGLKVIKKSEKSITLEYKSRRRMCYFAEGVIEGAAKHYDCEVRIEQPECCHKGDSICLISVEVL